MTLHHAFAVLAMLVGACGSPFACAQDRPQHSASRPNVLFIAIDDLNHWVGHLGRNKQTRTPNIDALAAKGVTFAHAYCAAPVCNPSRAALLTGLRPATSGIYNNGNDWRTVVSPELTLISTFRKAGYHVCGSGKIYHGAYERDSEWDEFKHPKGGPRSSEPLSAGPIAEFGPVDASEDHWADHQSVDYGIAQLEAKHNKPLFLAIGLHKPHMPWNVPRKYYDMHPLESIELPPYREDDLADLPTEAIEMGRPKEHEKVVKAGIWKQAIRAYLAAISFCDAEVGLLVDALDRSPQRDRTIVVLWGDHGWHLGEKHHWRKFALWEEATRAPLIWIVPGVTKAGTRCERTVDFMSIYPTLCELCGIETPSHVQGTSIRKLLADPQAAWDRPALTTYGRGNHAVRSEGWRYIRYADGGEELYDEASDPYEWTNLANDPQRTGVKSELSHVFPAENKPEVRRK